MIVRCKRCDFSGNVTLRGYANGATIRHTRRNDNLSRTRGITYWHRCRVPSETEYGAAATGVPCPKCGKHSLQREIKKDEN